MAPGPVGQARLASVDGGHPGLFGLVVGAVLAPVARFRQLRHRCSVAACLRAQFQLFDAGVDLNAVDP